MKKLIGFFLFLPTIAFCQTINSTESGGPSNIYNDAISRYINFLHKERKITYDTLYISKERSVMEDSLMSAINSTYIRIIDNQELDSLLLRRNTMILHFISPLSLHKGIFSIGILPLSAKRVKEENRLLFSGSVQVNYLYEPRTKQFRFTKLGSEGF